MALDRVTAPLMTDVSKPKAKPPTAAAMQIAAASAGWRSPWSVYRASGAGKLSVMGCPFILGRFRRRSTLIGRQPRRTPSVATVIPTVLQQGGGRGGMMWWVDDDPTKPPGVHR
jgi:hypothetical protein